MSDDSSNKSKDSSNMASAAMVCGTQQREPPLHASERRKDPMGSSVDSLPPPHKGGITGVSVTLLSVDFPASSDSCNPRVASEDNSTVADSLESTVASSTDGKHLHVVSNQLMLDPFGDGGRYSGVVLMSTKLPHGKGKLVYEDGRTHFGDWQHGRWHGWGQTHFPNGDSYEGFYRYDQRHGQGKYKFGDGRIYDGEFKEDRRHGRGHFTWPDEAVYVGDFQDGQRHGYGVYTFSHGGRYEGEWVKGRFEGYGEFTRGDGQIYKVCRILSYVGI